MTLHWWMHWFWITSCFNVYSCKPLTLSLHSVPEPYDMPGLAANRTKTLAKSSNIPPINGYANATAPTPTKLYKLKKLDSNVTNKPTTENPVVKETTVIDPNVTDATMENQTLVNASFNAISRADNLSFINEDLSTNHTFIVNSERIGAENQGSLTAAGITGITLGCVSIIGVICAVSFVMYRNYGSNRPQVLNDHCSNPDSSGYIDDSSVRENSEEMYSLDNDSFLNSLEAMTIQNLWTDTVKHTKL